MQSEPDSTAIASADRFTHVVEDEAAFARARQATNRTWALMPIVAASGFAGLGYEIVWTRQLSLALGTEMMAVLGAVAGFFGGLALGAFVLDRPIRRATSPWRVYAVLEAVIGLWGLISIWLLPRAGRALAPLLGTEPAPALLWAASFALPTLVLLPATMAMGGTLTALERMMRGATRRARVTAGVYGANTAGAVRRHIGLHILSASGVGTFRDAHLSCRRERVLRSRCARVRIERRFEAMPERTSGQHSTQRVASHHNLVCHGTARDRVRGPRRPACRAGHAGHNLHIRRAAGCLSARHRGGRTALAANRAQRAGWKSRMASRRNGACLPRDRGAGALSGRYRRDRSRSGIAANWRSRWRCSCCRRLRWERCSACWRNG